MTCTPTSVSNGKRPMTTLWLQPPTHPPVSGHHIDDPLAEASHLIQRDPPLLTPEEQRYGLE